MIVVGLLWLVIDDLASLQVDTLAYAIESTFYRQAAIRDIRCELRTSARDDSPREPSVARTV